MAAAHSSVYHSWGRPLHGRHGQRGFPAVGMFAGEAAHNQAAGRDGDSENSMATITRNV